MPALSDVYNNYLKSVRQLTGTLSAALFVESNSRRNAAALLVHEGKGEPLSEFKTRETASEFISELVSKSVLSDQNYGHNPFYIYRSRTNEGYSIRISLDRFVAGLEEKQLSELGKDRRKPTSRTPKIYADDIVWVALRCPVDQTLAALENLRKSQSDNACQKAATTDSSLVSAITLGAYMAWHSYQLSSLLRDPTSQLPGRAEFQVYLKDALSNAEQNNQPIGLVLVNPDEFGVINQRLDREKGDQALFEVAERLASCLRTSDAVFRYGGAVFAAVLTGTDHSATNETAEKLRHTLSGSFLDDAVRLTFSVGATAYHPADREEASEGEGIDLIQQAEHALNLAKLSGGGRCVFWQQDNTNDALISIDRLSGIFTADSEKDYRNMLLLWDTIAVISSGAETGSIAAEFAERIVTTFKPTRAALFTDTPDNGLQLLTLAAGHQGVHQSDARAEKPSLKLSTKQRELVAAVKNSRRIERLRISATANDETSNATFIAYAVPLIARETYLGCLYLDGSEQIFVLDSSDLIFLNALANQVALALDRATLAMQWKQEQERESQKLREEVRGLRGVLHSVKFVYRSAEMQAVLDTLSAVAPTDVTILITGESGTGKEMLARALHERSLRQDKPFITVDCGTIAHNLMEAELFGYVKGAYTGADGASEGRIVQAEGGTLFLDEIGEIPLVIQAKLLRFVQEKEINPVGATSSRRVDVRIVAATNRDLAKEVAAGRFRGDLYYRLQVITVTGPALRDRPDDILPLAQYFLEKFTVQYQKGVRRLTQQAEMTLLKYRWPGNVRELQNTILRAVVTSNQENIDCIDLQLASDVKTHRQEIADPTQSNQVAEHDSYASPIGGVSTIEPIPQQNANQDSPTIMENPWRQLQAGLEAQVVSALAGNNRAPVPLGQWLTEDLVLAADEAARGVARRASSTLGLAETTYRRQLEKVNRASAMGLLPRTPEWSTLKSVLASLTASKNNQTEENVVERARQILLAEVAHCVEDNCALGSALMGVTVPTFRRWVSALTTV